MVEQQDNRTITGTMGEKRVLESHVSQNYFRDVNAHNEFPSYLSYPRKNDDKDVASSSDDCDGIIRVPSGSGYRIMTPFPWRLHEMLEDIEEKKMSWIVSWTPDGTAFQVHSPEHFTNTVIPMYFRHKRYKSFQRQLYLYGFRSLQGNSTIKGAYFHPCFVKENRTLCRQIVRPKSVNTRNSRSRPLQSCKSLTEEPYYEGTDIFNESNINQANLQTLNICSSTSDANYQYTPFMLGQSFDPLSDHRGSTSRLISMPVLSKDLFTSSMFSGRTGVVSPSVDQDIPDNNVSSSDIQQETATQSLFRSLQQAMYGSHLLPRDDETPDSHQRELVRNVEDFQIDPSGSIYSMSVGNSTAMNFEALRNDPQHIIYGTASIQELEAYSDSIITLFGGGSGDFLD